MPPGDPRTPDDLGPYQALKTPTHKATYNRLVLLTALNHAPPIAALRGEMLILQSSWSAWSTKHAAKAALYREKHKAQAGVKSPCWGWVCRVNQMKKGAAVAAPL